MAEQTEGNYVTRPKEKKKARRKKAPKDYVTRNRPVCKPGQVHVQNKDGNFRCANKSDFSKKPPSKSKTGYASDEKKNKLGWTKSELKRNRLRAMAQEDKRMEKLDKYLKTGFHTGDKSFRKKKKKK
jgi:hypothetical protein